MSSYTSQASDISVSDLRWPTKAPSAKRPSQAPKLTGHEAFLKALEKSEACIVVEKISGEVFSGKVKHSDKYTISVEFNGTTRVLFKHDISEFSAGPRIEKQD